LQKKKFDTTTQTTATTRLPGPAMASAAGPSTQPTVVTSSNGFLLARRSTYAPMTGAVTITKA
jgi:hypothetical protein